MSHSKKPSFTPLFPPYLDHKDALSHGGEGESSSGLAVLALKCLLFGTKYWLGNPFEVDSVFDSVLAAAIKTLQEDSGFTGEDVDGCFGPATREAFKEVPDIGLDVNAIPNFGTGPHTKALMPDGDLIDWPPAPEEETE